ncbi:hypothetical protein [Paenibacillus sp. URB8-2]|uniref:hypothetical protein n=1 Tax=Paenibacillus sp. URB8-2 TaxID=2741301 RepID=UPI0015BE8E0A|nr:hypothetical protein [Paenibacillus sp. URB8-2]BCG58882.1 hypothetical protein PUR_23070 [Paenibacillus sp. URB8-2]
MSGQAYAALAELERWINGGGADRKRLEDNLAADSRLPGSRANLELAEKFARHFAGRELAGGLWELLAEWGEISDETAGTGNPREFLPFCAVWAMGEHYGYAAAERRERIADAFKRAMNDSRWRMREAAAMGLQSVGEHDFGLLRILLEQWRRGANELEQRAFVAALAHPPLLKAKDNARYALVLAGEIMEELAVLPEREPEPFRVLSKGLEYALSVFAAAEPEEGFALLERFAGMSDLRIIRIVKANLGKSRLTCKYGSQVEAVLAAVDNNSKGNYDSSN